MMRGAAVLGQLAPAVAMLMFLSPTTRTHELPHWQDLMGKIAGPLVLFPGYNLGLEAVLFATCVGLPLTALLRGRGTFRFEFSLSILGFVALYLVLPDKLFSGFGADRRLLVPLAMLAMISFDWTRWSSSARIRQWQLVTTISLIAIVDVGHYWHSYQRSYNDLQRLISMVERGALICGVMVNTTSQYLTYPPLQEVVSLAVIERSAFVPSLFVYPTNAASSPLVYTPAYARIAERLNIVYASARQAAQNEFDAIEAVMENNGIGYLLLVESPRLSLAVPAYYQLLGPTSDGKGRLFRIRK